MRRWHSVKVPSGSSTAHSCASFLDSLAWPSSRQQASANKQKSPGPVKIPLELTRWLPPLPIGQGRHMAPYRRVGLIDSASCWAGRVLPGRERLFDNHLFGDCPPQANLSKIQVKWDNYEKVKGTQCTPAKCRRKEGMAYSLFGRIIPNSAKWNWGL